MRNPDSVDDLTGFALCCGLPPMLECKGLPHVYCTVCGRTESIIGGVGALVSYWNRQFRNGDVYRDRETYWRSHGFTAFSEPELCGLGPGWRDAEIHVSLGRWGATDELERFDGFFLTDRLPQDFLFTEDGSECGIDNHRYLFPLSIRVRGYDTPLVLNWPGKGRFPYSYAYAALVHGGSDGCGFTLQLNVNKRKEQIAVWGWLASADLPRVEE